MTVKQQHNYFAEDLRSIEAAVAGTASAGRVPVARTYRLAQRAEFER